MPVTVLVVDDDAEFASRLLAELTRNGMATAHAGDGLAALGALDRERPHLVSLELELPKVSGFRLVQLLKRDPATARLPLLVVTGLSFGEAREALAAGVDDFLTKPVPVREVARRARRLLAFAGITHPDEARNRAPGDPAA